MSNEVTSPSGEQFEIRAGRVRAVVTELGAALRVLQIDGVDVLRPFGVDEPITAGHGQHLIPWPNRIRDGRYEFAGQTQQLALTEPARHNASHGLARWQPWRLADRDNGSVVLSTTVFPQSGWPGVLATEVMTRIEGDGLEVLVTATNVGATAVPFGYGAHPYLTVGEERVDEVSLQVPADSYLEVDDRMLPTGVREVMATDYDLRSGRQLGNLVLDTAFTNLHRDADCRWHVTLSREQRSTTLWGDGSCAWAQVFSGGGHRDHSIAVEPMTCGPDAFNGGSTANGLVTLEPGESQTLTWGINATVG